MGLGVLDFLWYLWASVMPFNTNCKMDCKNTAYVKVEVEKAYKRDYIWKKHLKDICYAPDHTNLVSDDISLYNLMPFIHFVPKKWN